MFGFANPAVFLVDPLHLLPEARIYKVYSLFTDYYCKLEENVHLLRRDILRMVKLNCGKIRARNPKTFLGLGSNSDRYTQKSTKVLDGSQ